MANSYTDANGVYRNKLGITDAAQLRRVEYDITARRGTEILEQKALGHAQGYGLAHQQAIHGHLFQDVYEWAGKPRTTPSSKSMGGGMWSEFASPETFAEKWEALEKKTNAFASAKGWTFEQKVDALAGIFVEANHIHPFPEGNGRSLQIFMQQLALEQGVKLDYTKNDAVEWNRASAVSGRHGPRFEHQFLMPRPVDLEPIKKIFAGMSSPVQEIEKHKEKGPARREALLSRKLDKTQVAVIASTYIDSVVKDPAKREALKAAVATRSVQREQAGKAPTAPMREQATPFKSQQPQRAQQPSERER